MAKRPGLNREKLVQAAVQLLQEQGDSSVTFKALAAHLGVRPPSLYNHVASLEELHRDMRLHGLRELQQTLQSAVAGLSGFAALQALCYAYRAFALAQPGLYQMTLSSTEYEDDELLQAGRQVLAVVSETLQSYALADAHIYHAIRFLLSAVHGFVSLELSDGFAMSIEVDESYRLLVVKLDHLLQHW